MQNINFTSPDISWTLTFVISLPNVINHYFFRGILFFAHGYAEHSRCRDEFVRLLCSELNIIVISHDYGELETDPCILRLLAKYMKIFIRENIEIM